MTLGGVLLIFVIVILVTAILLVEWIKNERKYYQENLKKGRRIFRPKKK